MGTVGSSVTPDVPSVGTQFGGNAEHMAHHRALEVAVETITVAPSNVYTLPGISNTTTTVVQLVAILAAAGLVTAV